MGLLLAKVGIRGLPEDVSRGSRGSQFIPQSREELAVLLDTYILDKAVYELGYELNNRPSWVRIPLEGISQIVDWVLSEL